MVPHAFNPSTQKTEAGRFLSSRPAWSGLQNEFQDRQGYTEKPCLKKPKQNKNKKQKNKNKTKTNWRFSNEYQMLRCEINGCGKVNS